MLLGQPGKREAKAKLAMVCGLAETFAPAERVMRGPIKMMLTTIERNALPDEAFGLPHRRAYPMPDASRAKNAKARATEEYYKGLLSKAEKAQIDAKADNLLSLI